MSIFSLTHISAVMLIHWGWDNMATSFRLCFWRSNHQHMSLEWINDLAPNINKLMLERNIAGSVVNYGIPNTIDQSHRYGRPQAACCEPAGSYDKTTRTAICFEHKTQYLLICAPYTRIVVFWHISNITPMISQSHISCNNPTFYIAAIIVKYCYTTGSWLL